MKSVDVKPEAYMILIYNVEINTKKTKLKVGDEVHISKHNNIFSKG